MNSICISSCVNDTGVSVRATYVNLYKWPESDTEFVKTVADTNKHCHVGLLHHHPRVVDSVSCRQLYLRSYTFSRKETVTEMTKKCLGKLKDKVASGRRCVVVVRRLKELSAAAFSSVFRRLLSCSTSVDVVDHRGY